MDDTIVSLVRRLNAAWQSEDWGTLESCFHQQVVLLPPDTGAPIIGARAVVDTYREFAAAAELLSFTETELEVFSFGTTHMAHMRFEVDYRLGIERSVESGLEVYAITTEATPLVVWRQQLLLTHRAVTS